MPTSPRPRLTRRVRAVLDALAPLPAPAGPAVLFLMVGLPGTGKSTFARALAQETGAIVVESDRFRRLLFGAPVFSSRESAALFQALLGAAAHLLDEGHAVVVDATNLSERDRRPFNALAASRDLPQFIVALEATEGAGRRAAGAAGGCCRRLCLRRLNRLSSDEGTRRADFARPLARRHVGPGRNGGRPCGGRGHLPRRGTATSSRGDSRVKGGLVRE